MCCVDRLNPQVLAVLRLWSWRITAVGHEQSFEQTYIGREFAGFINVIASIEDPAVIQKILAHLEDNATSAATALLPDCRASPTVGLLV